MYLTHDARSERHRPRVLLGLSVLLSLLCISAAGRADDPSEVVEVVAKLIEIPSKLPPDDLYDYAYVMRYQVIGGALDKTSILVAHYRPLVPRSKITGKMKSFVSGKLRSFVQGDVHKLKLSSELKKIWKGELVDDFEATDHKSIRYWCLAADPA